MLRRFRQCLALKSVYEHVEKNASFINFKQDNRLLIFFEKSNGKIDWIHNLKFLAVPTKPYKDMDKGGWFCHRGFLKVWKIIEKHLKDDIMNPEVTEIEIVGYSHGGAVAQLCYEYVRYNRPDVQVLGWGFGAPRVYWGKINKEVKKRFEGFFIIRNGKDAVTHLPPKIFGYKDVCRILEVGRHWIYDDFKRSVERKGLIQAIKDGDHFRSIKDHYPERYFEALEDFDDIMYDEEDAS